MAKQSHHVSESPNLRWKKLYFLFIFGEEMYGFCLPSFLALMEHYWRWW